MNTLMKTYMAYICINTKMSFNIIKRLLFEMISYIFNILLSSNKHPIKIQISNGWKNGGFVKKINISCKVCVKTMIFEILYFCLNKCFVPVFEFCLHIFVLHTNTIFIFVRFKINV